MNTLFEQRSKYFRDKNKGIQSKFNDAFRNRFNIFLSTFSGIFLNFIVGEVHLSDKASPR